jgi:hypothetical protein
MLRGMQRSTLELKKHQPLRESQISPKKQDDAGLILAIEIIPERRGWCQTLYFNYKTREPDALQGCV